MASTEGDRSRHFPAIEKKHGKPAAHWLGLLRKLGDAKYADQIAFLREKHGFSQAHANALVMHHRGSTTSKRFATVAEYLGSLDPRQARAAHRILDHLSTSFPEAELVVAWNQPMMRVDGAYVFGLAAARDHLTILLDGDAVRDFASELGGYTVNKKTFNVPLDDEVSLALLRRIVAARITASRK